jgi:hypothetical protein
MPSHEKRLFRRNKSLRYSLFDNPHVPKVRSRCGALWKHLSPQYQFVIISNFGTKKALAP